MNRIFYAGVVAAACIAAPVAAQQQPTQRQVDSLAAQLRVLRARLDSIVTSLGRGQREAPAPPAGAPTDDLAALRAAMATARGGSDSSQRTDTTPTQFVGRERNQAQLNP